ncbi:hypothetical protein FGO68_gene14524 [Halteria grandinella]|uniref:Uncharacterized protein n=1 Tax=Halteria grandinella TaxID=5974 RepID=A0A8J8NB72_HALGN|nr:hypothetical protein FGO68_gene14524 [Halteria grandinella]
MQKYYQPMLGNGGGALPIEGGVSQSMPSSEGVLMGAPQQQQQQHTAGLAAQMAIAHANMVMQSNPNNYHIQPLEDKSKKYSGVQSSRVNFAGVGQQQIFNHIRSIEPDGKLPSTGNGSASANPTRRWLPRE